MRETWQVIELNASDFHALDSGFATLAEVNPLWITYADSEAEADVKVETLKCNGKHAVAVPRPTAEPNPFALLHVMADPSARLSSGKTLQEHLASLAF